MEDKLNQVDPVLASKVRRILIAMTALGFPMKVIQGLRTAEYQHELWLQGRNADGSIQDPKKIVTNADGYKVKSKHQDGKAVDIVFIDPNGKILWDDDQPWTLMGMMGQSLGLTWGGTWKMKDMDHLEIG